MLFVVAAAIGRMTEFKDSVRKTVAISILPLIRASIRRKTANVSASVGMEGELALNRFKNLFKDNLFISDEGIVQDLLREAKIEHWKKGSMILEVGEPQTQVSFLVEGILRGFVVDINGKDITDCFAFRYGDVVTGCNEFGEPSQINIEALTDCALLQIPVAVLERFMQQYPTLLRVYNKILRQALKRHWETKKVIYQPAMQRYQWFLAAYPGLIDAVSNKYIASYLGITPVTLSRLRRQLRENPKMLQVSCPG